MELQSGEFVRLANNFYNENNLVVDINRIAVDSQLVNYINSRQTEVKKKFKVAMCAICLNPPYWPYAKQMIESAKQFFLPGHNVDYFLWSDMPKDTNYGATVFEIEPIEWPMPTLMRFHTMLQQEEKLKEYDYIFYCDVDMVFVNVVGDEILSELTACQHPMYALRKEYWPPYEPNKESSSYIPRPGQVINENGKPRFMPLYFAGGFQGGKAKDWIKAMKEMKKMVDGDLNKRNYIPIWNDESVWNAYLFKNPPSKVLSPSYIYPDSLIKEYYEKIWGCSYLPRLVTLTKKFSTSKEGADAVKQMLTNI